MPSSQSFLPPPLQSAPSADSGGEFGPLAPHPCLSVTHSDSHHSTCFYESDVFRVAM